MKNKKRKKLKWNYRICFRNLFNSLLCLLGVLLSAFMFGLSAFILVVLMNFLYNL